MKVTVQLGHAQQRERDGERCRIQVATHRNKWMPTAVPSKATSCWPCHRLGRGMNEPYRPDAPLPFPPTADENNLRLLSIFHYVAGGLAGLFSCVFIVHIVMGAMMLSGTVPMGSPVAPAPPRFVGFVFVCLGCAAVVLGWTMATLMIVAGRSLAGRRRHLFCLVVAGLECLWMPFGTILGVFTLVVLTKAQVRALFERAAGR